MEDTREREGKILLFGILIPLNKDLKCQGTIWAHYLSWSFNTSTSHLFTLVHQLQSQRTHVAQESCLVKSAYVTFLRFVWKGGVMLSLNKLQTRHTTALSGYFFIFPSQIPVPYSRRRCPFLSKGHTFSSVYSSSSEAALSSTICCTSIGKGLAALQW